MPKGMNPPEHNEPDDVFIGPMPLDTVTPVDPWAFWPVQKPVEDVPEVRLPKIAYNRPEIPSVSAEKARKRSMVIKAAKRAEKAAQRLSRRTERKEKRRDRKVERKGV